MRTNKVETAVVYRNTLRMRINKVETAVYTVYTADETLRRSKQQCIPYTLPMRINKVETAVYTVYTADEN